VLIAMQAFRCTYGYSACSSAAVLMLYITILLAGLSHLDAYPCWIKFPKSDFPQCKELSTTYSLHWRITPSEVIFGISLNATASWVSVGISEAGGASATAPNQCRRPVGKVQLRNIGPSQTACDPVSFCCCIQLNACVCVRGRNTLHRRVLFCSTFVSKLL
jgi:hypothetical protein